MLRFSDNFRYFLQNWSLNLIPTRQKTKTDVFRSYAGTKWSETTRFQKLRRVAGKLRRVAGKLRRVALHFFPIIAFFGVMWLFQHVRVGNLYDFFPEFHSDCPISRLLAQNSVKARPVKANAHTCIHLEHHSGRTGRQRDPLGTSKKSSLTPNSYWMGDSSL